MLQTTPRINTKLPRHSTHSVMILLLRELVLQVANNFEKLRLTQDEFMVAAVYGGE